MEIEHKVVCLPIDEKQMEILQGLEKEGYQLVPGVTPVAVYHLVRAKSAVVPQPETTGNPPPKIEDSTGGPQFKFTIDDSKIFVKKPN
jgi:hypothetical protein